jgi:hypothetical protein
MQFWGMLNVFAPQSGLQSFQLSRLSQLLGPIHPSGLCTRWLEQTSNLDLLLWCLCNAAGSALYQPHDDMASKSTRSLPPCVEQWIISPNSPLLPSYGCLAFLWLPCVTYSYLWLPCATYSYLQLPCATYYCILAETTLFIYHDLVSLAG